MSYIKMQRNTRWLIWSIGIIALLSLLSCMQPSMSGAMPTTDTQQANALSTIAAALTQQPTKMTATHEKQVQDQATAIAATLTAQSANTPVPVADLSATQTAVADLVGTAIAATLTAQSTAKPPPISDAPVRIPTQTPQATVTRFTSDPAINVPELLEPEANFSIASNTEITFAWKWSGDLQANQGFQISLWPVGKPGEKRGIHVAKETTTLQPDAPGRYHLNVDVTNWYGNGGYEWSVAVVWLEPYRVLAEASPRPIKINIASGDGGHRDNNSNNPGGAATRGP